MNQKYWAIYDENNNNRIVAVFGRKLEKEANDRLELLKNKAVGTNSCFKMKLVYDPCVGMSIDDCNECLQSV